jgi:hypothetical protein
VRRSNISASMIDTGHPRHFGTCTLCPLAPLKQTWPL